MPTMPPRIFALQFVELGLGAVLGILQVTAKSCGLHALTFLLNLPPLMSRDARRLE